MNREPHEKRTRINGGANTVRARSARAESEFGALFMRSPPFTRSRPYMRSPPYDHAARGIVYVGAAECGAPRGRVTNEGDRAIARVAHRRPDAARFGARLAHRRDPRLVGIDPAVFARPEIDEQNLTNADGPWMIR